MAQVIEQMRIQVADEVGKLADLAEALKGAGINILAANAWVQDGRGVMFLVTDDNEKACQTLSDSVENCRMQEVVCLVVPNRPGSLGEAARKLADAGIGIKLAYATVATGGNETLLIFDTDDNAKAAETI